MKQNVMKTDIQQLLERFLNAETTLEEEQTLYEYFQGDDVADDLKPYRKVFQGFAAVQGIDKPEQEDKPELESKVEHEDKPVPFVQTPAWVIVLRTVTSIAAVFLIGLFIFVNGDSPEAPQLATTTTATESTPAFCEGSTPRELYMCYMERKREQPSTYSLIKKRIYESQH